VTPRRLVIASLAVWIICLALDLIAGAPLAHDEAAYALLARDGHEQWLYRPIGLVALGKVGLALGGSDLAMRASSALLSLALISAIAALGKRFGEWTGAWAVAVIAGTHAFVLRGFQLLNDIPAAACLLGAAVIMIDELDRDGGPSYRLVTAAPLLACALYLRYGSVLTIGILGITAAVLWWRAIRLRPGPALLAVALFVILLAPFFAYSERTTGSALGILAMARDAATFPLGHGLAKFVLSNPFVFYGALVPPVMLAGLVGLVRVHRRRHLFLALVAIAQVVSLGLFSDGSARFIFVAIAFLVVLGIDALTRLLANHQRLVRVAGGLVVLAWAGMIAMAIPIQHRIAATLADVMTASRSIRADAAGRPCVVLAYAVTQLMWYSRCLGLQLHTAKERAPPGTRLYVAPMPGRPIDAALIAHELGATPIPLAGGAFYLRR
jgi:4-amino-4-deoxy-L-arabinose transferase-like glycosyltransferase